MQSVVLKTGGFTGTALSLLQSVREGGGVSLHDDRVLSWGCEGVVIYSLTNGCCPGGVSEVVVHSLAMGCE